jgi:protease I
MNLNGKKIAILATNGFEQSELEVPRDRLRRAGATIDVVSLAGGEIKGWDKKDRGRTVKVDKTLDEVAAADYDAVVLPGGQINPDLLRVEPKALKFIKDIFDAKKVVAAICHAPWLLIETGIAKGRKMTSYKSIRTDVANAGAKWENSEVVVDQGVITSRNPGDLEALVRRSSRRSKKAGTTNEVRPDVHEEHQDSWRGGLRDPCRRFGLRRRGVRRADEIRERRPAYGSLADGHRRFRKGDDRMVRFRKEDLQKD